MNGRRTSLRPRRRRTLGLLLAALALLLSGPVSSHIHTDHAIAEDAGGCLACRLAGCIPGAELCGPPSVDEPQPTAEPTLLPLRISVRGGKTRVLGPRGPPFLSPNP